ncbi:MAG: hypothetical protein K2G37_03035 [Clostridia bacterium]|nr:hypothetical protein [Clostridia bacterium]MDE7328520.1 hypothetical protein [Clostridia bacterium]
MDSISIKVYAKVNIYLDIDGVREDGYHLLDMRNVSVDVFDIICAKKSKISRVIMDGNAVDGSNTAVKALKILEENFGISMRVEIKKGIPFSAGLGGSSADASGVFYCAHKLYGIDFDKLKKLAVKVGCDVPYMMSGGNASVKGVGEIVAPEKFKELTLAICQSAVGASTKEIYAKYDEIGGYVNKGENYNALEKAAVALAPKILTAKEQLLNHTDRVFMTGSGSAFVGIFDDLSLAVKCIESIGDSQFKAVVKTVDKGVKIIAE